MTLNRWFPLYSGNIIGQKGIGEREKKRELALGCTMVLCIGVDSPREHAIGGVNFMFISMELRHELRRKHFHVNEICQRAEVC